MKCVTFVLQVKFYEKLSGAVRSASSSVSDSAHTSPRGSRSTSPKVGGEMSCSVRVEWGVRTKGGTLFPISSMSQ